LYCDTDSVICDYKGFKGVIDNGYVVDEEILGALKNEYPFKNSQLETNIEKIIVINKKVY